MSIWPIGLTLSLLVAALSAGAVVLTAVSGWIPVPLLLAQILLACVFGLPAFFIIISRFGSLSTLTNQAERVASGELNDTIFGTERGDDIGRLARSIAKWREDALRLRQHESERERLTRKAEAERRLAFENLATAFEARIGKVARSLGETAGEIHGSARNVTTTSAGTTRESERVASAGARASANVRIVAEAAETLSTSINEIARRVSDSSSIAGQAVNEVARTDGSVKELASAAARIGEIVALINGIAAQTNLLALNATIEAARAGEAGKGFAVVASEVKALAGQTARATDDIRVQIEGMQVATGQTVNAIREISATIGRMSETAISIAAAVAQQGEASREIASSVLQVAGDAQQVSSTIASVSSMAAGTDQAVARLMSSAESLGGQTETMRQEVDSFLDAIRAA